MYLNGEGLVLIMWQIFSKEEWIKKETMMMMINT